MAPSDFFGTPTPFLVPTHTQRYIAAVKIVSWNINSVRFRIAIVEQFLRDER